MLLEADNVISTYNYTNLLTSICKHAPVFIVKVSRPYFLNSPQGAHEKFGLETRLGGMETCSEIMSEAFLGTDCHLNSVKRVGR